MEYTLKLALQYAKRTLEKCGDDNYGTMYNLWNECKALYHLREEDEKELF